MVQFREGSIINYLTSKLVGAGFSIVMFVIIFTIQSSLDLFELSEILSNPWIWIAFYGYALLSSFIIDWIASKSSWAKRWSLLLHIMAGFMIFFPFIGFWITVLIAGPVGAGAALIFFLGMKHVSRNKWTALIFALILPIVLLIVSITDFTKKEDWNEISQPTSYEATFSYFNGEHKIPVTLKKGEELLFDVDFNLKNEAGWGQHLENIKGKYMPMDEREGRFAFTAKAGGEYYIVVGGHHAKGSFTVNWEIHH